MEDPNNEDWEIKEYTPSEGSNYSKGSWILNKGLMLGKKIVITGVVISSAPLVLPPIMVVSALGFAFSIPFGLVFATYACTEKLMSKLLPSPSPTSPPLLENGTMSEEEEEVCFGGDVEMEEVEKEQRRDMKVWADEEMGVELVVEGSDGEVLPEEDEYWKKSVENDDLEPMEEVDDGYEENVGEDLDEMADDYGHKRTEEDEEELGNDVNEKVKEEGYEEDVCEYLQGDDERLLAGLDVKVEGISGGEEEEEPVIKRSKGEQPSDEVHQVVVVEGDEKNGANVSVELDLPTSEVIERGSDNKDNNYNKEVDLASKTTGLLEKLRDEGVVGNNVEKDWRQRKEICEIGKERDENNFTNAEGLKKPFEDKSVKVEKLILDVKEEGEGERRQGPREEEIQERRDEEIVDAVSRELEQIVEMGYTGDIIQNMDNSVEVKILIGNSNGSITGRGLGDVTEVIEEQRPVANKKAVPLMQSEETKNQIGSVVLEGLQFEREKEHAVNSNADAREIADESGLDLFDARNEAGDKQTYPEEFKNTLDLTLEGSAEFMELHVSVEVPQLKHVGIDYEMDTAMPANKVLLSEEKIWEHIDALRKILGYEAPPHATCIEELKALYTFTGVGPPASFKNPSDLVEVNDKLQFLMSIVGVK